MIQVSLKNDALYISFKGNKFTEILELVRRYQCKFNPSTKEWIYKNKDYQILSELKYIDKEIIFDDNLSKSLEEKREVRIFKPSPIEGQERKIEGLNIKLFPHQFGDVDFLTSRSRALLASTMGCVDKDTEFFNGYKWKKISEYNENDLVLQYNQYTQEATLCKPIKYIKQKCNNLYYFKTRYGINQCLSAKHEILYLNKQKEYKKITCEEMVNIHNRLVYGFTGKFITTFKYNGKGLNLSNAEIKVMLAVIADGHFPSSTNRCVIHLKRKDKILELRKILKEANIKYKEIDGKKYNYTEKSDYEYSIFRFYAPRREKIFTKDWYNCTQEQLQLICNNVLKWDGSNQNSSIGKRFFTTIKESADFIQFAFSTCNLRAAIYINNRSGRIKIINEKRYITKSIEYNITISNRINPSLESPTKAVIQNYVPIDGYEYCFTVPTHNLVLRRNNCIFITGNCGKTFSTIASLLYLKQLKYINNCLIIAPKSVLKEWKNMIDNNTDYKSNVIKGSNRKFTYDNFFNLISFDSLSNDIYTKLSKKQDPEAWLKVKNKLNEASQYNCLIIDEAHLCCNPKSQRSKAIRRLCKNIKYVYCLTATPIVNTLDNIYNIFNLFLVPNLISYTEYRYKYCVLGGWMGNQVIGYKNFDKFVQLIQPYTRRILKSQVSDKFPKKTESIRWIDLHKEQMKFYDNVKEQLIKLPNDYEKEIKIKKAQELALISYLKQACILTNLIDNSTNYSSKIDECLKIIDEKIANNEKVVVYCFYLKACEYLKSLLEKKYGVLYLNSDNSKNIDKIKEEFKKDENQVLIMTKTGQVGLNLEMASCFIFLTLEWTHASLVQLYSRIDRITQTKPIEIIYLIANNTYEERIFDIINYKKGLSENITDKLISLTKNENKLIMENI